MELGTIRRINIDSEMQASYLDYAMSVIVARALPDVRDGLKPVHRRILYAMHDLGLQPDKPYKKSARIVGEVLGKYHPHGDAAVYESMVRMAQDFSLRYPLVDGQGNFGSVDGDGAAAMRYTEARLAHIATEMLADIEKDTVDWTDNFDGTLKEPAVLPAALPNLLVNGASGIAVGMATNIPPHNLGEVCDALCYLIDNYDRHEDVTIEDLMRFIPGPDFPTGGVIYRYQREGNGEAAEQTDIIAHAYAAGKGSIVMQAKAHIEDMSRNRSRIVVTELPYQTNKTNLIERIAELARDGRLEGLTDLRDESDRTGMRLCIEMTRTVEPRKVLADLFKLTPLQQTFGVSMLALVDGEPRLLSLKRMLMHFLEHREEVILRRSKFELEKAKARAHIVEGLLRALDVLDEVIALIRASKTVDTAKQGLMREFKFTEIQAQAILDMQLRRLAALERRKLQDEYRELIALIRTLEELLKSPKKVLALIKQNLIDLKARYGDARRTQIADRVQGTLTTHDLLPDEDVWVTLSPEGALTRWRRGAEVLAGKGAPPHLRAPAALLVSANTRDDLYLFSVKGQATRIGVHQISEGNGSHFADLSGFTRRDRIAALIALPKPSDELPASTAASQPALLLATTQGKVKRVALTDFTDAGGTDPQVIGLDDGDELLWAGASAGDGEFLLVTAQGQAIRFREDEVRAMGLAAGGVGGIKLAAKDRVVAAIALPAAAAAGQQTHVAVLTALGFGKRVPVADFPTQGRNGQGVTAAKPAPKLGSVAGAALTAAADSLLLSTAGGGVKTLPAADLPEMGRPAQGKAVLPLVAGDTLTRVQALAVDQVKAEPKTEAEVKAKAKTQDKPAASAPAPAGTSSRPARAHKPAAEQATLLPDAAAPAKPARGKAQPGAEIKPEPTQPAAKAGPAKSVAAPAVPPAKPVRGKAQPGAEIKPEPTQPAAKAGPAKSSAAAAVPPANPARGKGQPSAEAKSEPKQPAAAPAAKAGTAQPVPAASPAKPARGKAQPSAEIKPEAGQPAVKPAAKKSAPKKNAT